MPEQDEVWCVAREFFHKGDNDLKAADQTLRLGHDCPTDTVGFHAQQAVEKYLKGMLVFKSIDFPKVHDIGMLLSLLPSSICPKLTPQEQRSLTDYATVTRYPGDYEEPTLAEARQAVKIAKRVRRVIRKALPRGV